jgi:subtilase family serine protease
MKKSKCIVGLFIMHIVFFCMGSHAAYAKSDLTVVSTSMKLSVKGLADEDKTSFDMGELYDDRTIKIEVTVRNISSDNASPVNTGFYVDGERIGRVRLRFLPSRTSKAVSVIWAPKRPGKYTIKAVVDYEDKIDEDNETNNTLEKEITITEGKLPIWYPVTIQTDAEVIVPEPEVIVPEE